jgi:predicted secreted protein
MGIVTGIVLYAIIWFMTLLVALQVRVTSQDEAGERVAGTHGSAPADAQLKTRIKWTSLVAAGIWAVVAVIIIFELVTLEDIDLFTRFGMGSTPES